MPPYVINNINGNTPTGMGQEPRLGDNAEGDEMTRAAVSGEVRKISRFHVQVNFSVKIMTKFLFFYYIILSLIFFS